MSDLTKEELEVSIMALEFQIKQQQLIVAQREAAASAHNEVVSGSRLRPSHYCPISIEYDDIRWSCKHINCVEAVAYGNSPEEAMMNFDKMWLGIVKE